MKSNIVLLLTVINVLVGCSSSTNTSNDGTSNSVGSADTPKLRLISSLTTFSDGKTSSTSYQYDEKGNLVGAIIDDFTFSYEIDSSGKISKVSVSGDGVAIREAEIYHYDSIVGLRRIDGLGFLEGVGIIGVSRFELYKFDGVLATSLETRRLPFDEIELDVEVEDTAGTLVSRTEFIYDGDRLSREFIDTEADGIPNERRDYTYNSDGTLASTMVLGKSTSVYSYEQGPCNLNWGNSTSRYFCITADGL